ncbi:deoxyribodipyrimidine photo-lyase [Vibrio cholerae]|uniref:deoxyribodipyrimidine photo-lyase n=1 Tax=Vibrio cholerae TaxID=666 RepID=UPI0001A321E5|nr:deoxyribodipyrimidine photo-lyase [Vibrio cholerae]EEN99801.1 deoxyribodipyrimidine photolyase [Vibrio cholerae 12129(1)]KUO37925.1 deoxyribodipyrimidine photolyase [Vibrio cholerae]MDA5324772.1 deoxyribodipyrimidine photo-lyase [Vibrio cholerae]HDI3172814.1 deoxyribodipyrimidine photo-lyase [Vibrio cholerae]HDI3284713.1 deoxyribodipyrimidine photo-lyase [Vibrio cholerae]
MRLVWFRRDLRSFDNTALTAALNSGDPVAAMYIATPEQWHQHHLAPIQADLIWRRLAELQQELAALNVPLFYQQVADFQAAAVAVSQLAKTLNATQVLANRDYELDEQQRDQSAQQLLSEQGITWSAFDDKCVLPPGSVRTKQGEFFKVFTPFKRAWLTLFQPPVIGKNRPAALWDVPSAFAELVWHPEQTFDYPRVDSTPWAADFETVRAQLRDFCRERVQDYHQARDFPAREGTSSLSPYLAIGVLSARQCVARLYHESSMGELSEGAQVWLSELIWREFYQHLVAIEPNLSKSRDFVEWGARLEWWNDNEKFQLWCEGKTGYPIVDAAMRQLNQTGWMHNRLRMIVASFLTKDLHIDWRWGERYFMSRLIDGDYAANNGGWQWCASTGCDGQPYFRIFNPVSQGEKFDPNGDFIRRWVPELRSVSSAYIHQPWTYPAVNSVLYPARLVDHKQEREVTLRLYKTAKG